MDLLNVLYEPCMYMYIRIDKKSRVHIAGYALRWCISHSLQDESVETTYKTIYKYKVLWENPLFKNMFNLNCNVLA